MGFWLGNKLCAILELKMNAQAIQDKIYRKMSAQKKIELLDDFYRFARVLQKKDDHSKVFNKNKRSIRKNRG